jgi:tetratricopeptide (TPR) repeat protein
LPAAVDDTPDGASMSRALFAPERGFEDDPANTFFPDELAEAEFFIQQELLDEAREILEPILEEMGDSERVKHMLARVAAKEAGEPEPPPPWQQKIFEAVASEASSPELSNPGQVSVEEVLSQFKKGVAETVPEDDAATHYDIGIAYREMGLLDDAVGEFEVSARAEIKAPDAWFMIGLVRLDQGRSDDALAAFERAVGAPGASREQRAASEYQLGVVYSDHRGDGIEALLALKRSRMLGGNAPDLDRRIQALVKVHGDVDVAHSSGASHSGRPKNIDYV